MLQDEKRIKNKKGDGLARRTGVLHTRSMTGKPGRSGRPKNDQQTVAFQVRLPVDEAEAFKAYVQERSIAAAGTPDALSAATVLRALVRTALGLDATEQKGGKPPRKPKA